jgi:hypothetical protein
VQQPEEREPIAYRSTTRGGFGVSLALGGKGVEVAIGSRPCSAMIFNRAIAVLPDDEGKVAMLEEAEEIARDVGRHGKR